MWRYLVIVMVVFSFFATEAVAHKRHKRKNKISWNYTQVGQNYSFSVGQGCRGFRVRPFYNRGFCNNFNPLGWAEPKVIVFNPPPRSQPTVIIKKVVIVKE